MTNFFRNVLAVSKNTMPKPHVFGIGPFWKDDGDEYWSNGVSIRPSNPNKNIRNKLDRATADQFINFADYSPGLPSFVSGTNPVTTISTDGNSVICSMDGTTGVDRFCGLEVVHPSASGYWDLSATYTYPGQSADTVLVLDIEFPSMPNGNDQQVSTYLSVRFITGAAAVANNDDFTSQFHFSNLLNLEPKAKRQTVVLKASNAATSGTPNWAEVRRIEVRVQTRLFDSTAQITANIRGLYVNVKRKGRVLFTFDDAHTSAYTEIIKKHFKSKGWGGTLAINRDYIGQTGKMVVDNIIDAQTFGFEVANHTTNHIPIVIQGLCVVTGTGPWTLTYTLASHGLTAGQAVDISGSSTVLINGTKTVASVTDANTFVVTETVNPDAQTIVAGAVYMDNPAFQLSSITDNSQYFIDNGIIESDIFVYPNGAVNDNASAIISSLGFKGGRGTSDYNEPVAMFGNHYGDQSIENIPTVDLTNTTTSASMLATIDDVLAGGGDLHIYGHQFVTTPTVDGEMSISEMELLITGIQARIDSGLCDVPIGVADSIINY